MVTKSYCRTVKMSSIDDFVVACEVGDLAWMRRCLRSGLDPVGRDRQGVSGLHMVCKEWHCDCLRFLLDHCHVEVGLPTSPEAGGETPLHLAVPRRAAHSTEQRCIQVIKTLLDHGADPNCQCSGRGQTPLHLAARVGDVAVVKLLLQAGAGIQVQDRSGFYALDMARVGGHYEVARLLQALHWATDKDRHDNHILLQRALQEETAAINQECVARDKRYRAVRAYEVWQEQNCVSDRTHVEPGACQFRLEQRGRVDAPGSSSCSSCRHSATTRSKCRTSSSPSVRPLCISSHQSDKNLTHIGRPGYIYPYSNYPAQEHRAYSKGRTSSQASSAGGSRCRKLPLSIRRSARPHRTKPEARGAEVQEALSVTAVGLEPTEDHCQGPVEGDVGAQESGAAVAKEEADEEDVLGSPGELTFHEVQQQSLKALPDAMYLQELLGSNSPALQPSPASRDRDRRLSLSQINHRHNVYRGKMHRRLSLGAIPEGRMVRQYYKEEEEEEDMLGSVLWDSVAWQVVLASQRQYSSAPLSPVSGVQQSVLNARILGRLGTAADDERELVYSDSSSSDEEEEEEGRRVPRPDTPLPFLACGSSSSSSHSLSSPSSPRLTSPSNQLEDCRSSSSNVDLSAPGTPPDKVPSSPDAPPDKVPSSPGTPPDKVPSSHDVPPDKVPSSPGTPPDKVPSSHDVPPDKVPSSHDVPPDKVPSTLGVPPDKVPSTLGVPPDKVPSTLGVPPDKALFSPSMLSSPVLQERCEVPCCMTLGTPLCVTGGRILPSSRPSQRPSRSATPRTSPTKESPRSGFPSRASPLRSKSSAGIRGTSSMPRLSSRRTQSSSTLLPHSASEGRVAVQPTLMQFGGGLVAVTAGLSHSVKRT